MNSVTKSLVPPMALASVLAVGFTLVWLLVSVALFVIVAPWLGPWFDAIGGNTPLFACLMVTYLLSPLNAMLFLFVGVPISHIPYFGSRHAELFDWRTYFNWSQLVNFILPVLSICIISAIVSTYFYRRHQKLSNRDALPWAIFIAIWGLPGIVGYLLHRRWPPMEQCQHCRRLSPRDRDACLHCQSPFPTPPLKGIEIFA